jgi:oligopeptide/dipeptide ABC transporter ATP-binding protein
MSPLLEVEELTITLPTARGPVRVIDGVSLAVDAGQVLGIAGESGSGKTMTGMALLGLLPDGARVEGSIRFDGRELTGLSDRGWEEVRGHEIAVVFQDPSSSVHPMLTIGHQLTDHVRQHLGMSKRDARARAVELLDLVRIPNPQTAFELYPHQFSGGMRQRIAIAIALACRPRLLIADEPTTALDVTVQAGIVDLLAELREQTGMAVLAITHDLGVISSIADRVDVFYAGRVVESGTAGEVLGASRHPYTRGLLEALPHEALDRRLHDGGVTALKPIPGMPPSVGELPGGCSFNPRCAFCVSECTERLPALSGVGGSHDLRCHVDPWGEAA